MVVTPKRKKKRLKGFRLHIVSRSIKCIYEASARRSCLSCNFICIGRVVVSGVEKTSECRVPDSGASFVSLRLLVVRKCNYCYECKVICLLLNVGDVVGRCAVSETH